MVIYMSDNKFYFGFAVFLVVSALMFGTVSAISIQSNIGEYETAVNRDSVFLVPVSVTSDGPGTVSVILYPKDGLSCDVCVSDIVFDTAGTEDISFTVSADNTGIYENPFDIEVSMDGSVMTAATADIILSVGQLPILILDFSSDIDEVSIGDTVLLTLSLSVTGPIDGISADLNYPDGWSLVSGNRTYDVGKVTGTYNMLWKVKADNPSASDDFSVTVTSSDPVDQIIKTLSVDVLPSTTIAPEDEDSDSGLGNHQALPTRPGNTEATHRPTLVPGMGLMEHTRLTTALENAFGTGNMTLDTINDMMRISESISSQISMERNIEVGTGKSNMHTSLRYNGNKKLTNFVVYDIVPKSFALSAEDITVTAPGARVEIVEDDPEFAIIFESLSPGDTIDIDYEINSEIDADIVSTFTAEVYATGFEEDMMCAQVMTPAKDSVAGDCVVYPTPCDVPDGWDVVGSCPFESSATDNISDGPAGPAESNIYKYLMIMSLLGIVSMVVVLRKNRQKKYSN